MKKLIYILFLCVCFSLKAQPPANWYNKFGGNGVDVGYDVQQIFDKQYVVVGSTSSFNAKGVDGYFILVDSMGQMIWQKIIGGALTDVCKSVAFNPTDSGFVFCGYSNSIGNGGYDIWVGRTNKTGNLIWQRNFGGLDWDFGNSVTISADGNIVACGSVFDTDSVNKDAVVIKYDMNGNLVWNKTFGGEKDDDLNAVIRTNDNQLFAVGYTKSFGEPNGDNYLIKLNNNGDTVFTRRTGGSKKDFVNDVLSRSDGTYIYTGGSASYTNMTYVQSFMTCIDASGNQVWTNNHYNSNNTDEWFVSVNDNVIYPFHTFFLRTVPVPLFANQGNVFYCTPGGWPDLVNSFGGFENELMYNSSSTSDGGSICVGETFSYGSIDKDVYVIKLDTAVFFQANVIGIKEAQSNTYRPSYINDHLNKKLSIFNQQQNNMEITLVNMAGQEVRKISSKQETIPVDYVDLSPDIYILIIEEGSNQRAFKIPLR